VEKYGFDFPYSGYWSAMGWVESRTGDRDSAIARLREGLSLAHHAQTLEFTSHLLGTIAQLQLEMGASREGLATIDEALAFVEATGERFWEAEIHRLKGTLLLLEGADGSAEACLRRALEIARSQGARSLELRAATSLSQLWSDKSRKDEARSLLASVYGGFTEGFDTQDLRDAKALLDSL